MSFFFGVSSKSFRRDCNNCNLQVHRKNLWKKFFWKFIVLYLISDFLRNFSIFIQVFALMLLSMQSTFQKLRFRAGNFPWKIFEFVCSSGIGAEKCRPSGKKVSAGLWKLYSTCPQDRYWGTIFILKRR